MDGDGSFGRTVAGTLLVIRRVHRAQAARNFNRVSCCGVDMKPLLHARRGVLRVLFHLRT